MNNDATGFANSLAELPNILKFGPIGPAGLMLILVIGVLIAGRISITKERILLLYLRIDPLDMETSHNFPPPKVTINNQTLPNPVKYRIISDITAIVDVSRAINFVEQYTTNNEIQQSTIIEVASRIDKVQNNLARQNIFAINDSCSGGPHGIPSSHSNEITALNTSISADVASIKGVLESAAQIRAPASGDETH